jgi:hypothetical protein
MLAPAGFHSNEAIITAFQELATKNDNLIIELKKECDVQFPEYFLVSKVGEKDNAPIFEIQENITTQSSLEYLLEKNFFPKPEIKALPVDVFNLQTNFTVKSFEDIVRLNEAQKEEVKRLSFFDESLKSRPALQILYENTLSLNMLLEETLATMLNPKNNMHELQENLLTISNVFDNFKKLNVKFFSKAEIIARQQAGILAKKQEENLARQTAITLARQHAEMLAQQHTEVLAIQGCLLLLSCFFFVCFYDVFLSILYLFFFVLIFIVIFIFSLFFGRFKSNIVHLKFCFRFYYLLFK